MTRRRKFTVEFKTGVAPAALRRDKTGQEIAAQHTPPCPVSAWRE